MKNDQLPLDSWPGERLTDLDVAEPFLFQRGERAENTGGQLLLNNLYSQSRVKPGIYLSVKVDIFYSQILDQARTELSSCTRSPPLWLLRFILEKNFSQKDLFLLDFLSSAGL